MFYNSDRYFRDMLLTNIHVHTKMIYRENTTLYKKGIVTTVYIFTLT